MTTRAPPKLQNSAYFANKTLGVSANRAAHVPALTDEHIGLQLGSSAGAPVIITINCIARVGLTCDVAKIIFEFGLNVVQADFSTDGQWCLLLLWVVSRTVSTETIQWTLLKNRFMAECPCPSPLTSLFFSSSLNGCPERKYYFLQTCSAQSVGLLNDLSHGLWELELEILKVNLSTSPSGCAVVVILISDHRSDLPQERCKVICDYIRCILGPTCSFCDLIPATLNDFNEVLDFGMLLYDIPKGFLEEEEVEAVMSGNPKFCIDLDNSLSPSHTLLQVTSPDRKGLVYDCMRVLNDLNLKVAYSRLNVTSGMAVFELFICQANGTKLLEPHMLKTLQARLKLDVFDPVRVMMIDQGSKLELFVATTLEKSGRTRPRIMRDVTLVLKMLQIDVFKAETERISNGDRIWEVYRFLVVELPSTPCKGDRMRSYVAERVKGVLCG